MSEEPLTPKKVHSDQEELESLPKPELINRIKEQEQYIRQLENKKTKTEKGDEDADFTERLRQQQKEAARRENTLVHRLTTKEQELQDFMNQIAEIKQAQTQGTAQLRSMLLDPAVNTVFQKMAKETEDAQEKLKQTQNELSAWKFTPDSQTGKRLMARCQMLLQENEELGKTIASGRTAKLEGEISLMKTLVTEMKNNQSELDEFLGDLEEDVEGMQTMIYVLQQQLREAKEQISSLEEENTLLRAGKDTDAIKAVMHSKHNKGEKTKQTSHTEDTNHTSNSDKSKQSEHKQLEYAPMDTGSYYTNEKTESDLEAEYNYEGLYENEDKYQEMDEQQVNEEGQYEEYEENGYKNYEEEYESQHDFRVSDHERALLEQGESTGEKEQELMDTSEGGDKSGDSVVTSNGQGIVAASNHISNSHSHSQAGSGTSSQATDTAAANSCSYSSNECSDADNSSRRSRVMIDTTTGRQQHQVDSVTASSDSSTNSPEKVGLTKEISATESAAAASSSCESKDSNHVSSTQKDKSSPSSSNNHHSQVYSDHSGKERTSDLEQIPGSPKPTKVSPVKVTPSKSLTPEEDGKSSQNEEHDTVSTDKNPSVMGSGDPTHVADLSPEEKGSDRRTTRANSSPSNKRQSPSAATGMKEREPVLQKFLNGVTSTVEDIEDI